MQETPASTLSVDQHPSVKRNFDLVSTAGDPLVVQSPVPVLKMVAPKQRRLPAPIKIYSDYTDSNEPQTSIYVPALPLSSTSELGTVGNKPNTPQRAAPIPPMNRPNSILVLSAPNSARRNHTPTENGSHPAQMSLRSQNANSWKKEFKNVRFSVIRSPAYSNLKSPAYVDCFRSSHSPMLHSPSTHDEISPEDPDEVFVSPIEDAPMLSIAPFEAVINQEEESLIGSSPTTRGRQVDPESFLRLTGRPPSLTAYDQDPKHSAPDFNSQRTVSVFEDSVKDPSDPRYLAMIRHGNEARNAIRNR